MRICIIAYKFYESSPRIRQFATTYHACGHSVDVYSLGESSSASIEILEGIRIHRIQRRIRNEKTKFQYLLRTLRFLFSASIRITAQHSKQRYDLVQIFGVPDFLVLAAWRLKLDGTPILLDVYDLTPELYCAKFGCKEQSAVFRILVATERFSASLCDHVIAPNPIWKARLLSRSVPEGRCTHIPYYSDDKLFHRGTAHEGSKVIRLLYAGTLNSLQGLDIAIRAFSKALQNLSKSEFHIYGEGPQETHLATMISSLHLESNVFLHNTVPVQQLAEMMAQFDIMIVPKRISTKFGAEAASTKIWDGLRAGLVVIAARTPVEQLYFSDEEVFYFTPEDEDELASAIIKVCSDASLRSKLRASAEQFLRTNNWENHKDDFMKLVGRLTGHRLGGTCEPHDNSAISAPPCAHN